MKALLLAALACAAPAAPPQAKAVFDQRVEAWVDGRDLMHARLLKLRAALAPRPRSRDAVLALWGKWRSEEKLQSDLHDRLVANQAEAAKAGLLTPEQLAAHKKRLGRLLKEKLLWHWSSVAPRELNAALKALQETKVEGYPFRSYPAPEEYERLRTKDRVPVYEDGVLRTVK